MDWKEIATTAAGAFLTGAGTWATTQMDTAIPSTSKQWTAFGIGTAIGGLVAVGNWLRKSPLKVTGGEGEKS